MAPKLAFATWGRQPKLSPGTPAVKPGALAVEERMPGHLGLRDLSRRTAQRHLLEEQGWHGERDDLRGGAGHGPEAQSGDKGLAPGGQDVPEVADLDAGELRVA